jgi:hypothetical protein
VLVALQSGRRRNRNEARPLTTTSLDGLARRVQRGTDGCDNPPMADFAAPDDQMHNVGERITGGSGVWIGGIVMLSDGKCRLRVHSVRRGRQRRTCARLCVHRCEIASNSNPPHVKACFIDFAHEFASWAGQVSRDFAARTARTSLRWGGR